MEAIKRTKIVDVLKSEAFGTTVNGKDGSVPAVVVNRLVS